jgi:myo-inositol-1(or 4)-monophosphatase
MDINQVNREVIDIAKTVGEFIRHERRHFDPHAVEYKGLNDMVSYVDKTAEQKIVGQLQKVLPEAGFITEEKTVTKTGDRFNWIIDPLDGTTNFIHGIPVYSVSIALQEYDQLVAGVVYEVNLDECFHATSNSGAYLNNKEIKVSKGALLKDSLLATGFPYYDFQKQAQYLELFADLMRNCHGIRRIGSAAVDLAYTACGRFEGFYEYNLNAWDIAAGIVLVKHAGGEVVNFTGGSEVIKTRELLATNGKITGEMLEKIGKYF